MKGSGAKSLISKSESNLKKGMGSKKKSLQNLHSNSKSKTSMHSGHSVQKIASK